MIQIRVQAIGADKVVAKINVAKVQLTGPMMDETLGNIGAKGVSILRAYLPVKTGRTRRAVAYEVAGAELTVGLGTTTPPGLGAWLLEGTKPHSIQGSPLRFQKSGDDVYRPRAQHPGTKPLDMSKLEPELERAVDNAVDDQLRKLEPQLSD